MAGKRGNGEGTFYKRKDGRWLGQAYVLTTSGQRKRISRYGKTRQEVQERLASAQALNQRGMPVADHKIKLEVYIDYWLETFVKVNKRPHTYSLYEMASRRYIKPSLGKRSLSDLTVPMVQSFLHDLLKQHPTKVRTVQMVRTVLSAVLTRAQREELLIRNVAHLVEPPQYKPEEVVPWTTAEASAFLEAAKGHTLYPAFQLLTLLGLRRGEVLGLRWCDVDFRQGEIRIRQALQRIGGIGLVMGEVKTDSGRRDLPMLGVLRASLLAHQTAQRNRRAELGDSWGGTGDDTELVFTTSVGTWIEPDNFGRTFRSLCRAHDVRIIKLHHIRHSLATRLKELNVPLKDAQGILGHASATTTMAIYQHDDMASRTKAIGKVESIFAEVLGLETAEGGCSKNGSKLELTITRLPFLQSHPIYKIGGPGGTRTLDILLKRQPKAPTEHHLQSVKAAMEACTRELLVGCVAVNFAVTPSRFSLGEFNTDSSPDVMALSSSKATLGRVGLFANGLEK